MSCLASLCLLLLAAVCVCSSPDEVTLEPATSQELVLQDHTPCNKCPWRKKSATLVPAFTKTTTPRTTTRRTKRTTSHTTRHPTTSHPTNHTTLHPTKHTTGHLTTPRPTKHTTGHLTTPRPTKHTTGHLTTPRPTKNTTGHLTTPRPTKNTTGHLTTPRPTKHTTGHLTTPRPTKNTTGHLTTPRPTKNTTGHLTTPRPTKHTTGHLTTPRHSTVAPTPSPAVVVGDYKVKNGSEVCLRFKAGLQTRVEYMPDHTTTKLWGSFAIPPNRTTVSGNCTSSSATLQLAFSEGFLLFTFFKNTTRNTFYLSEAQANLRLHFPGTKEQSFAVKNQSLQEFQAGLGRCYHCENRSLTLSPAFHLDAVHEQVQAFALKGGEFGEADECLDRHSPLVPIIIGVVLLILILIILIAYLIGRHRSRGGYQTI